MTSNNNCNIFKEFSNFSCQLLSSYRFAFLFFFQTPIWHFATSWCFSLDICASFWASKNGNFSVSLQRFKVNVCFLCNSIPSATIGHHSQRICFFLLRFHSLPLFIFLTGKSLFCGAQKFFHQNKCKLFGYKILFYFH